MACDLKTGRAKQGKKMLDANDQMQLERKQYKETKILNTASLAKTTLDVLCADYCVLCREILADKNVKQFRHKNANFP